jgi:hypothetical protein
VSACGLDDRAIEFRSPAEVKGFFLYPLRPDRLWVPPSLLYNGTGGPFPRAKAWPGRDADHSPHLVPRSRSSSGYTSSPRKRLHGMWWDSFWFLWGRSVRGGYGVGHVAHRFRRDEKFILNFSLKTEGNLDIDRRTLLTLILPSVLLAMVFDICVRVYWVKVLPRLVVMENWIPVRTWQARHHYKAFILWKRLKSNIYTMCIQRT